MTSIHVLTVRGGKVLGGKNYFPDEIVLAEQNNAERLAEFILSFYFQVSDDLPAEIIVSEHLPDADTIAELLSEQFGKKHKSNTASKSIAVNG